jgi:hypothetical protein
MVTSLAERFERAEVSLAVPLGTLVLLHVVHHHLEAAVHATVVEIEAETPDFKRFAAALVLARIDACVQLLEDLIVPREQRAVESLGIAKVHSGFYCGAADDDALMLSRQAGERHVQPFYAGGRHGDLFDDRLKSRRIYRKTIGTRHDGMEPELTLIGGNRVELRRSPFDPHRGSRHRSSLRVENAARHRSVGPETRRREGQGNHPAQNQTGALRRSRSKAHVIKL